VGREKRADVSESARIVRLSGDSQRGTKDIERREGTVWDYRLGGWGSLSKTARHQRGGHIEELGDVRKRGKRSHLRCGLWFAQKGTRHYRESTPRISIPFPGKTATEKGEEGLGKKGEERIAKRNAEGWEGVGQKIMRSYQSGHPKRRTLRITEVGEEVKVKPEPRVSGSRQKKKTNFVFEAESAQFGGEGEGVPKEKEIRK